MSATLRDVAREVGMSVATVSRVVNAKTVVSDETRERVLAAIERLAYVPHSAARSLITSRTSTIGVLLPDVHGEFFSELIRGIDIAARRAGFHVLVSGSHSNLAETEAVLRALHGRVDGLLLMTPGIGADSLRRNLPRRVPVVLINSVGSVFDSIRVDNRGGARALVEHLYGLGHRRIAFVRGPASNEEAAERLLGYREALAAHRLPLDPALELAGDFDEDSGYLAGVRLATFAPRPDAIFAANDSMAIGCLSALRERGLRVPEDVALAGFDDIPIARYLTPALTSVRVSIAELGGRAMERLLNAIERGAEGPRRHEVMATQLVVRASCGAASATRLVGVGQNPQDPGREKP